MTQTINSDLMIRMSALSQEYHILQTNTNLFMRTIKDEIQQQQEDNLKSRQICDLNTQSVSDLKFRLDEQVGVLFKKYEEQVNQKISEFENFQKHKEAQEQNKIKELEQRFNLFDETINQLDKKWESKSNDRYIASIIQKNLLTNQNLGQFIVDKVLKLTEGTVENKLTEHQKQIDERITNQFHQISTLQNSIRRYEKIMDELQSQINVQKEFSLDFQKQQQKKIQVIQHQSSLLKEVVQQQVHNIIEQSEINKASIQDLREQLRKDFEDASTGKLESKDQIMQILAQEQQKLRDLERKLDLIFRNDNEMINNIEAIKQDYVKQIEHNSNKILTIDCEVKNLSYQFNGIQEKLNTITLNPPNKMERQEEKIVEKPQEKFRPLLISQKIQKQFSLKDQIGQIEQLFKHVQLLFNHIIKTYQTEKKMQMNRDKIKSDHSVNASKDQLNTVALDHPQYVFQKYNQQQKQEQNKDEPLKNEFQQQTNASALQNQLKINLQPVYQGNEDFFGDTRLYFNSVMRPMYVQGKQHAMDIRPQIEMSQLSAKVKQISNMFCDSDLRQQLIDNTQSCRPNSARKRLPQINSKSFNISNDEY